MRVVFVNTFATPVALKNIHYNYAFIFVAWDVIESIILWFFAVETVGHMLEELAEVFEAPIHNIRTNCSHTQNPVKASIQKQVVAIRKDGAAILVDGHKSRFWFWLSRARDIKVKMKHDRKAPILESFKLWALASCIYLPS